MPDKDATTVFEVLTGIASGIGLSELWKFGIGKASDFVKEEVKKLTVDKDRGPLAHDLWQFPENSPLRTWLKRAQGDSMEGEITTLLIKLPVDKEGSRKADLDQANQCSSYEEFLAAVDLLRHDNAIQLAKRIRNRIRKNGGFISEDDLREFRDLISSIGQGLKLVTNEIDRKLSGLAGFLEARAVKEGGVF